MKILHSTIKKRWFDMILSGEKLEEYKEIKPFWASRLLWDEFKGEVSCINSLKDCLLSDAESEYETGVFKTNYDAIQLYNGWACSTKYPNIILGLEYIHYGTGNPNWGAEPGKEYFIIKLGKLISKDLKESD